MASRKLKPVQPDETATTAVAAEAAEAVVETVTPEASANGHGQTAAEKKSRTPRPRTKKPVETGQPEQPAAVETEKKPRQSRRPKVKVVETEPTTATTEPEQPAAVEMVVVDLDEAIATIIRPVQGLVMEVQAPTGKTAEEAARAELTCAMEQLEGLAMTVKSQSGEDSDEYRRVKAVLAEHRELIEAATQQIDLTGFDVNLSQVEEALSPESADLEHLGERSKARQQLRTNRAELRELHGQHADKPEALKLIEVVIDHYEQLMERYGVSEDGGTAEEAKLRDQDEKQLPGELPLEQCPIELIELEGLPEGVTALRLKVGQAIEVSGFLARGRDREYRPVYRIAMLTEPNEKPARFSLELIPTGKDEEQYDLGLLVQDLKVRRQPDGSVVTSAWRQLGYTDLLEDEAPALFTEALKVDNEVHRRLRRKLGPEYWPVMTVRADLILAREGTVVLACPDEASDGRNPVVVAVPQGAYEQVLEGIAKNPPKKKEKKDKEVPEESTATNADGTTVAGRVDPATAAKLQQLAAATAFEGKPDDQPTATPAMAPRPPVKPEQPTTPSTAGSGGPRVTNKVTDKGGGIGVLTVPGQPAGQYTLVLEPGVQLEVAGHVVDNLEIWTGTEGDLLTVQDPVMVVVEAGKDWLQEGRVVAEHVRFAAEPAAELVQPAYQTAMVRSARVFDLLVEDERSTWTADERSDQVQLWARVNPGQLLAWLPTSHGQTAIRYAVTTAEQLAAAYRENHVQYVVSPVVTPLDD